MRLLIVLFLLALSSAVYAQTVVQDSVVTDANFQSDVWYSMQNGTVQKRSANEWDLAFQIEAREAGIRINSVKGVKLWLVSDDIEDWAKIDTTGKLTPSKQLYNSDTSWNYGAFNMMRNWRDPFDYGWGKYNQVRNVVVGSKIFVIELADKRQMKIRVDSIDTQATRFKLVYANLDGTNEKTLYIDRSKYASKNFVYYDFTTDQLIDREPPKKEWDLLFTQYYTTVREEKYPVAGVLQNYIRTFFGGNGVRAGKRSPVNPETASDEGVIYRSEINTIGYDWKTFDQGTNSYKIQDSLAYFVEIPPNSGRTFYYKIVFTGFGGRGNGLYRFYKTIIRSVGRSEIQRFSYNLYPNPAQDFLQITLPENVGSLQYQIYNLNGQELQSGTTTGQINVAELPKGHYQLVIRNQDKIQSTLWIKE
jgi:hypothetical protein